MLRNSDDIIIKTVARVFIPFIQLYALYVIMHGHYSPGGGFQGGVILGASLVLLVITHGLRARRTRISERGITILSSTGVLIYAGIGALCLPLLGNFLDYSALAKIFNVGEAQARSLGILGVEIGVAFTVMAVMFSVFITIATGGKLPEDEEEE